MKGYYVMGRYNSVAWFANHEQAERCCQQLNYRGGTNYYIEEEK